MRTYHTKNDLRPEGLVHVAAPDIFLGGPSERMQVAAWKSDLVSDRTVASPVFHPATERLARPASAQARS